MQEQRNICAEKTNDRAGISLHCLADGEQSKSSLLTPIYPGVPLRTILEPMQMTHPQTAAFLASTVRRSDSLTVDSDSMRLHSRPSMNLPLLAGCKSQANGRMGCPWAMIPIRMSNLSVFFINNLHEKRSFVLRCAAGSESSIADEGQGKTHRFILVKMEVMAYS